MQQSTSTNVFTDITDWQHNITVTFNHNHNEVFTILDSGGEQVKSYYIVVRDNIK